MKRLTLFAFLMCPMLSHAIPAFPGAQGRGAVSVGGRGGAVIEVTNLNDSGSGSLRACAQATGPRTCIFRTGGTIVLNTDIIITTPFLTIAGQTAPGGGVQIRGAGILVRVPAHNVIVRYIRLRRGWDNAPGGTFDKGFGISGRNGVTHSVIVDHSSIGWQQDDNDVFDSVRDITLQRNIYHEGNNPGGASVNGLDGKGLLFGSGTIQKEISVHHNFLTSNYARNPAVTGDGPTEFVNNVIYNWGPFGMDLQNRGDGAKMNIIGNTWKAGPDTLANRYEILVHQGRTFPSGQVVKEQLPQTMYVSDNFGPKRTSGTQPQFALVGYFGSGTTPAPASFEKSTPWPVSAFPITISPAQANVTAVLDDVGASKLLNADGTMRAARDAVDNRLVAEYNAGTGNLGGDNNWPVISGGVPPADADHDGMPDVWESARGLNPNNAADRNGVQPSGYTNLEVYLAGGATTPTAPTVSVTAPANGATVAGSAVTVSATATDDVSVAGVQFKLDGSNLGAEDTTFPYSVVWNTTAASEGSHTLTAVARDGAPSTTTSSPVTVVVDNVIVPPSVGPVSHWRFDGNGIDSVSANNNSLTLNGGAGFAAGPISQALSLNGTTGSASDNVTTSLNATSFTITAWLKPTTLSTSFSTVLTKGSTVPPRGYGVNILNGKLAFVKLGVVGITSTVSVPTGSFHHVAVTWEQGSNNVKFYLDGDLAQTLSSPGAIVAPTNEDILSIGVFLASGMSYFNGLIDDARIYNRVLDAGEISALGSVAVLNTAPTVSLTSPTNGATVSGNVTVTATAEDPGGGIVGVQFKLDGANLGAEDESSPYSIVWKSTLSGGVSHQLGAVARDTGGLTTTAATRNVTVNNIDICP